MTRMTAARPRTSRSEDGSSSTSTAGSMGQGTRNADALPLAAGKARGVRVGVLLHGNAPQFAGHAGGNLGAGDAQVLRAKGNVVGNHAGHDLVVRVLEDQAQLAAGVPVGREVGHARRADRVARQARRLPRRGPEARR